MKFVDLKQANNQPTSIKKSNLAIVATLMLGLFFTAPIWAANQPFQFEVTPVAKNVYSIISPSFGLPTPENRGWNSNSHFIVTNDGVLLFDTGSSEAIGKGIKKAIETVTDAPVRWVINSHSHADHWFGNAAFANAEIITSEHAFATMKDHAEGAMNFYNKVTEGTIGSTQLAYPTVLLKEGQKRNFGGVDVEIMFSNDGHSPGDLLVWLPKQRIILGGDVLGSDWMPIITGHGDVPHMIQTLRSVSKLKPAIVLTGHGSNTNADAVKRDIEFLSSIWQRVRADHQKDQSAAQTLVEVKATMGPKYSAIYKDFDSDIERYVKLLYELQS